MDSCGDEISRSSASSDDSGEASSLSAVGMAEGNPGSSPEDSKCRKSSRLKAKLDKQAQDGNSDAYNLRLSSLVKRVQVERNRATPKQPKGKSKPPPLSKYRRRTANARERQRMQEINEGYENLRQCLPDMEAQSKGKKKEKPTKFTILSLAINYIHALRDTLGYPPLHGNDSSCSPVGSSHSSEGKNATSDNNNNCTTTTTTTTSCTVTSNDIPAIVSCSEDSNGGSESVSVAVKSVSSGDEACSNPSPVLELKDCPAVDCAPLYVPSMLHTDFAVSTKHLSRCHDPLPGSAIMMEFREEARSSPSSSSSNHSLSPSPPPLPLPEDCMDLEESDLLNVSISLPAFAGMEDIVM